MASAEDKDGEAGREGERYSCQLPRENGGGNKKIGIEFEEKAEVKGQEKRFGQ